MAEHGRLPTKREVPVLAKWIGHQRQAKKAMDTEIDPGRRKMTHERIAALEAVPCWTWDLEALWLETLEELTAFVAAYGRLPTRRDSPALAEWVVRQRRAKKDHRITPARIATLEALPWWTWTPARGARAPPRATASAALAPPQRRWAPAPPAVRPCPVASRSVALRPVRALPLRALCGARALSRCYYHKIQVCYCVCV